MKKQGLLLLMMLLILTLPQVASATENQKIIAVTFDDGPSKYTGNLLTELAQRQVVVTFFMQGRNAERYPDIVQKAYESGHQIASHTYNHPYLPKLNNQELQSQLNRTISIFNKAIGTDSSYMLRPPYGSYNAQVLAQIGTPAILWSVDTRDWQSRNADAVYQSIVKNSRDGSIILMHDLYPSTITGALRGIDYLQSQGYELVTVRELLRRRGISPSANHTYSSAYNKGQTLPGLTPPQISYDAANNLLTLSADSAATIYYTLDGTPANSQSSVYTEPLTVNNTGWELSAFTALDLNGGRSQRVHLLISKMGNCFADVYKDSWYYEDVDRVVAAGLLTTDNNYFYPEETATEQMAAILIQRLTNNQPPEVNANQPLTRQRLVQLLYQAMPNLAASHNELAQNILKLEENQGSVTRAELAAIIMRLPQST